MFKRLRNQLVRRNRTGITDRYRGINAHKFCLLFSIKTKQTKEDTRGRKHIDRILST